MFSLAVAIIACLLVCVLPVGLSHFQARKHQKAWHRHGSDDYTITISAGVIPHDLYFKYAADMTLEVCAGKIVRINGEPCIDSPIPENCENDPIFVLFDEARGCGFFCKVEFDDEYGFPYWIVYEDIDLSKNLWAYDYAPITCP